jgi:hypothetical protein
MNIRCPLKPYTYDISVIALPMDLTILWALLDFMNSLQKEEWTSGLGNSEKEGCVMPPLYAPPTRNQSGSGGQLANS